MSKNNKIKETYTQREAMKMVGLPYNFTNRQKLCYLRLGRTQCQLKRDGRSEYFYQWKPQLIENLDWFYQRGKVFYTAMGINNLQNICKNKQMIYTRGNDL